MNTLESALAGIEQMTSKATEGPWKTGMKISRYVYSEDMLAICECDSSVDDLPTSTEDCNAQFIAASRTLVPALVKALRVTLEWIELDQHHSPCPRFFKPDSEQKCNCAKGRLAVQLAAILANGREGL